MKFTPRTPIFPRRTRVIARSVSPPRTLWDYANSNLVIWLLTAVVGSFITLIYSNQQSCVRDAEQRLIRISNIKYELIDRAKINVFAANFAPSGTEFQQIAGVAGIVARTEFKEKSGLQLWSELRQEFAAGMMSDPFIEGVPKLLESNGFKKEEIGALSMLIWPRSLEMPDDVLKLVKPIAAKTASLLDEIEELDAKWYVASYCSLWDSLRVLWADHRPTIAFVPSSQPLSDYFRPMSLTSAIQKLEKETKRPVDNPGKDQRSKTAK